MKKKYLTPDINCIGLTVKDVITASVVKSLGDVNSECDGDSWNDLGI